MATPAGSVLSTPPRTPRQLPSVSSPPRRGRVRRRELKPGWPLVALFAGFPLWWVLGFGDFSCLIFAVPMALHLVRRGHVSVPRGFGTWLLFLVWVLGGVLVLQVHAPGTVPGHSLSRYFTFGYRILWYVAATVVLLYIGNTRKELSDRRVSLAFSYMFVVVTFGGVLGVLAPHLQFRSLLEYVLPHRLSSSGFVHGLIHPVTAQVQTFLGYDEARPSAPFAFTNEWGLAIACFLPFFLITWCRRDSGWRRYAAPVILLFATVAVVFSLNRGLWLALAAAAVFVAVRYALMGHLKMLAALAGGAILATSVIVFSPLGSLVLDRFAHPDSNQGRTNLGSLTLSSVLQGSPLVGFGSTRNVLGNFQSIAAAASAACPGCSPPPLGTQGHLWLVLFSQGLVGLALYLVFFVSQLVRHIRMESPYVVASLAVIVMHLVTMPVYDTIGPSLFPIMAAVALLWRATDERAEARSRSPRGALARGRPPAALLSSYGGLVRRHAASLAALAILGAMAGAVFQAGRETPSVATQSILLPSVQSASGAEPPVTVDTDAQLITSDPVLSAVAKVAPTGLSRAEIADRLTISATPNTRILHVAFAASSPSRAIAGVEAATTAFLNLRSELTGGPAAGEEPGRVVRVATVQRSLDSWKISITSGIMVALCLGLVYWWLVGDGRARIRRSRALTSITGLPVIAVVATGGGPDPLADARRAIASQAVTSVLATSESAAARSVARVLDDGLDSQGGAGRHAAVIVASTRTRVNELTRLHATMRLSGQQVVGAVLVQE